MKQRKERQRSLSNAKPIAGRVRVRPSFNVKAANTTTRKAIAELEAGEGKRFTSLDALMADLSDG